MPRVTVGCIIAALVLSITGRAQQPGGRKSGQWLEAGKTVKGEVIVGDEPHQLFRIKVPNDAVMFEVRISDAPANLDLLLRHGAPIKNLEDPFDSADYAAVEPEFNESVQVTRWHAPPLRPGVYFVYVVYPGVQAPVIGKRRSKSVPFAITCDIVRAKVEATLEPGKPHQAQTSKRNGFLCMFRVNVPDGARCLRLDLSDVGGDLDLYARRGETIVDLTESDHEAAGLQGRESMVIDRESDPPLAAGTYTVAVVDEFGSEAETPFSLHLSFAPEPPTALMSIPTFPQGKTPLERAVFATVELIGPTGGGSGSILTPDGLILTNYHVVADPNGKPTSPDELIIAITLDPRTPPTELFRARVVAADKDRDLALVAVGSGLYRQPVPDGYRFVPLALGDPNELGIGDSISIVGYPSIGGTRSRPSITLTRGIVSGFELHRDGSLIKTDAALYSGTSGGSALNQRCELIGVPSETVQETEGGAVGQVGFIRPLSLLPTEWRARINERLSRSATSDKR